jgi:GNAT superfamily N-acetyltransferase
MLIREFKISDAEECSKIRAENYEKVLSKVYSAITTKKYIELFPPEEIINHSKNNKIFVAKENEKIVGFISVKVGSEAEIKLFFVSVDFRNKGIGSKLYLHAENWIKRNHGNVHKIFLHGSMFKPTISFYEKMGFENKGKVIHVDRGEKLDCVWFTKRLNVSSLS